MHSTTHLPQAVLVEERPHRPDLSWTERRVAGCLTAATAASAPALRRFARGVAALWGLPTGIDEALGLVVSELVGNAVRHSGSPDVALLLSAAPSTLTVEVRDNGRWRTRLGLPRQEGELACDGRGLEIVGAYASRCTVRTRPGGTHVTVELSLRD